MMTSGQGMKLEFAVGLEVKRLGSILAEENEGLVEARGVSVPAQGELIEIVGVYLRFVCTRAHNPLSIVGHPHTDAGLFELEVLEKVDSAGIFGVILQTPLPSTGKPVWQRPACGCARDSVYWHKARRGDLHASSRPWVEVETRDCEQAGVGATKA